LSFKTIPKYFFISGRTVNDTEKRKLTRGRNVNKKQSEGGREAKRSILKK